MSNIPQISNLLPQKRPILIKRYQELQNTNKPVRLDRNLSSAPPLILDNIQIALDYLVGLNIAYTTYAMFTKVTKTVTYYYCHNNFQG